MKLGLIAVILFLSYQISGQTLENVNFAVATHPMKVNKIENTANQTIVEISIENQIDGGNFCADKSIDIVDIISKEKLHLIKAQGIPVCPANYQFKAIGEVLTFSLIFPKIKAGTKYINIIENCNQYCFRIKGIILSKELNNEINLAYSYYSKGKLDFALEAFKQIVQSHNDYPFGFIYFNIIQILAEKQDFSGAKGWYTLLNNSNFEDKAEVIARLRNQVYFQKIN